MNIDLMTQELTRDEGKRNKVYLDTCGIATIGIGRNIRDLGLSDDECNYLLQNDIARVSAELDHQFPWWRDMTEARQRVILNMCFNLGLNRLLMFVNTLVAMKEGRYDDAAAGMLDSVWAKQVGARATRLAQMMKEG